MLSMSDKNEDHHSDPLSLTIEAKVPEGQETVGDRPSVFGQIISLILNPDSESPRARVFKSSSTVRKRIGTDTRSLPPNAIEPVIPSNFTARNESITVLGSPACSA